MSTLMILMISIYVAPSDSLSFDSFKKSCVRTLDKPLHRFWGSRPHPDLSMIGSGALWRTTDKNLEILPRWEPPEGARLTMPFMDTHIAVRFLGGVSKRLVATDPQCQDSTDPHVWCDLVRRDASTGALVSRFDLVQKRLDPFIRDAGMDVMIVLDNVPWAFVNETETGPCQNFGCQYNPPDDPQEFADWVGGLARYIQTIYGANFASRVRWRLGTEANGPRWSLRGKYWQRYWDSYRLTALALRRVIPAARVGASNWVEVVGHSGNLTKNGSDWFQWQFYEQIRANPHVPLDWVSVSHYGGGGRSADIGSANFPRSDWVQRTPGGNKGQVEVQAMKALANRPNASMEVMEWSILNNELNQPTWEPSSVGTAWSAASVATWMCHGTDRIFHWETGTTLRNSTGDNRIVNFYEQWPWNMAFLELFIGGTATFSVYQSANRTIGTIESVTRTQSGLTWYALVGAVGYERSDLWETTVQLSTNAFQFNDNRSPLQVKQYRMNSTVSVVETIVRELQNQPELLLHNHSLPFDFNRLLTDEGFKYVEAPKNLERYWKMHTETFKPSQFEGSWERQTNGSTTFSFNMSSFSVTVVSATLSSDAKI